MAISTAPTQYCILIITQWEYIGNRWTISEANSAWYGPAADSHCCDQFLGQHPLLCSTDNISLHTHKYKKYKHKHKIAKHFLYIAVTNSLASTLCSASTNMSLYTQLQILKKYEFSNRKYLKSGIRIAVMNGSFIMYIVYCTCLPLHLQCGKENGGTTRSSTQCGKSSNLSMDITEVIQINANNLPNSKF